MKTIIISVPESNVSQLLGELATTKLRLVHTTDNLIVMTYLVVEPNPTPEPSQEVSSAPDETAVVPDETVVVSEPEVTQTIQVTAQFRETAQGDLIASVDADEMFSCLVVDWYDENNDAITFSVNGCVTKVCRTSTLDAHIFANSNLPIVRLFGTFTNGDLTVTAPVDIALVSRADVIADYADFSVLIGTNNQHIIDSLTPKAETNGYLPA